MRNELVWDWKYHSSSLAIGILSCGILENGVYRLDPICKKWEWEHILCFHIMLTILADMSSASNEKIWEKTLFICSFKIFIWCLPWSKHHSTSAKKSCRPWPRAALSLAVKTSIKEAVMQGECYDGGSTGCRGRLRRVNEPSPKVGKDLPEKVMFKLRSEGKGSRQGNDMAKRASSEKAQWPERVFCLEHEPWRGCGSLWVRRGARFQRTHLVTGGRSLAPRA